MIHGPCRALGASHAPLSEPLHLVDEVLDPQRGTHQVLVAWVLIGMALALCLYMRRRLGRQRRETPTWSYEAVAQPEQERDVEMDAFTLGDEDDT